jgi:DNA ligase D
VPKQEVELVEAAGVEIRVTNPSKVFFPKLGVTKLDLVRYYVAVADGALVGCRDRPSTMLRYPDGVEGKAFFQKRVPTSRPDWLRTATIHFPSGRRAEMIAIADAAHLAWATNMGCVDINPWPVRAADVDHPDELRIDLDPTPGVPWADVRDTTMTVRDVLEEHDLVGFPKTSGKRGMHVVVRIEPRWEFTEVRRSALALAREIERRMPDVATTKWWKEERRGVFVDYNQNARDRTTASVYSVRPVADARVSTPLAWDEVPGVEPEVWTIATVPERYASGTDPSAALDNRVGSLEGLLELALRDEHEGLGDAPWPPNFPKAPGEPVRAQPSRRRAKAEGTEPPPER